MVDIDLNEADHAIIEVLREGRNTPANIARRKDYTREYVANRLKRLVEHDVVDRPDRGIYELIEDPEESSDQEESEPTPSEDQNLSEYELVDLDTLEFDRDLTPERREVLREFFQWVRDEGPITKADFEEDFYTEERSDRAGYNTRSFWEAFGKASLKQLDEVSQPNARTYRWTN